MEEIIEVKLENDEIRLIKKNKLSQMFDYCKVLFNSSLTSANIDTINLGNCYFNITLYMYYLFNYYL